MGRKAQTPHTACGMERTGPPTRRMARSVRAVGTAPRDTQRSATRDASETLSNFARIWRRFGGLLSAVTALALIAAVPAAAQDPSIVNQTGDQRFFKPAPGGPFGATPKINSAAPLYLQGDDLVYDTKNNRVIARGNVQIFYNNFLLTADEVAYDQGAAKLVAKGNAQLRDPNGNITRAETIEATDDFRDAFVQSLSVVSRDETRIQARRAIRRDGNVTEFQDGRFTACKNEPGKPPLWCISGARIIHDQQAATLTYQDARFELFGTPILEVPYFQMPDPSVRHRSGFLTPTFGSSSTLGLFAEIPYYFALDKSYDFLFHPELLSKQGVLYKGDFRQRLENGEYTVKFGAIDQSVANLGGAASPDLQGWRGTVETKGVFSLGSWWRAGWDVTLESDRSFRNYYGFDSVLQTDRINTAYLTGLSERNYFNLSLYQFGGLVPNDTDVNKSRALPVIDYNYIASPEVFGGELSFDGHLRNLSRVAGLNSAVPSQYLAGAESTHLVTDVNWRRKIIDPIGQSWTPFVNLRGDVFQYQNTRDPLTGLNSAGGTDAFGVGSAGLTYAYPFVAHTAAASHTLEPVVQIVTHQVAGSYHPDILPNEDAKSVVFDDTALFFESKSTGFDRIDTGTRLNYGTRYNLQFTQGLNIKAVVGESLHLSGTNAFANPGYDVTSVAAPGQFPLAFSPNNGLENNRSDYVAGLYVSPLSSLSLVTQARFDSNTLALRREDTLVSAGIGPLSGQVAYAFSRDNALAITNLANTAGQQEVQSTISVKLTDRWNIAASLRYDIDQHQRLQDLVQLRYADECFVLTTSYTESFIQNPVLGVVPDKSVMVRIEFKNLGSLGAGTDLSTFSSGGVNNSVIR